MPKEALRQVVQSTSLECGKSFAPRCHVIIPGHFITNETYDTFASYQVIKHETSHHICKSKCKNYGIFNIKFAAGAKVWLDAELKTLSIKTFKA